MNREELQQKHDLWQSNIANWEFYSKTIRGAQQQNPRNERAISSLNWSIGQAIGKLYVAEKFPPQAKANAQEMIDNIIEAFKVRIQNLNWMNEVTKLKAIEKLEKIVVHLIQIYLY